MISSQDLLLSVRSVIMSFSNAKDDSLLVFYESVRRQVDADTNSGGRYRFLGETAICRTATRGDGPAAIEIHTDRLAPVGPRVLPATRERIF